MERQRRRDVSFRSRIINSNRVCHLDLNVTALSYTPTSELLLLRKELLVTKVTNTMMSDPVLLEILPKVNLHLTRAKTLGLCFVKAAAADLLGVTVLKVDLLQI